MTIRTRMSISAGGYVTTPDGPPSSPIRRSSPAVEIVYGLPH